MYLKQWKKTLSPLLSIFLSTLNRVKLAGTKRKECSHWKNLSCTASNKIWKFHSFVCKHRKWFCVQIELCHLLYRSSFAMCWNPMFCPRFSIEHRVKLSNSHAYMYLWGSMVQHDKIENYSLLHWISRNGKPLRMLSRPTSISDKIHQW